MTTELVVVVEPCSHLQWVIKSIFENKAIKLHIIIENSIHSNIKHYNISCSCFKRYWVSLTLATQLRDKTLQSHDGLLVISCHRYWRLWGRNYLSALLYSCSPPSDHQPSTTHTPYRLRKHSIPIINGLVW